MPLMQQGHFDVDDILTEFLVVAGMYLRLRIEAALNDTGVEEVRIEVPKVVFQIVGKTRARLDLALHSRGKSLSGGQSFFFGISESVVYGLLNDLAEIIQI